MSDKIKIICTLGPSTYKTRILSLIKKKADIFRINMSHTETKDLSKIIKYLKKNKINNICIDTEGAQIRTKIVKKKFIQKNKIFYLTNKKTLNKNYFRINVDNNLISFNKSKLVKIGFEELEAKVLACSKNLIKCKTIQSGYIESNKGIHFDKAPKLPSLTNKDKKAIKIANQHKINIFALSFANQGSDVMNLKKLVGKKAFIISKIETQKALKNLKNIIDNSNAILIDRGDLSRYVKISKIPYEQLKIINTAKKLSKDVYVATNLLESMVTKKNPTRAESNDIFFTLLSGCKGLVLAAETAIGKYPDDCINFVREMIKNYNSNKNKFKKINLSLT